MARYHCVDANKFDALVKEMAGSSWSSMRSFGAAFAATKCEGPHLEGASWQSKVEETSSLPEEYSPLPPEQEESPPEQEEFPEEVTPPDDPTTE